MARRCGFCGSRGHDRRTCEKLTEVAKENPNGYWAREKARIEKNKKTVRKCSWCNEPGHTKRTCTDLKQAIAREEGNARIWNKNFLDKLKENGLGVGSLIRITAPGTKDDTSSRTKWINEQVNSFGGMALVMGFIERDCVPNNNFNACMVIRGATGLQRRVPLPYHITKQLYQYAWKDYLQFEIAGKVSDHQITTSFSQDWHQGIPGARAILRLDQR